MSAVGLRGITYNDPQLFYLPVLLLVLMVSLNSEIARCILAMTAYVNHKSFAQRKTFTILFRPYILSGKCLSKTKKRKLKLLLRVTTLI